MERMGTGGKGWRGREGGGADGSCWWVEMRCKTANPLSAVPQWAVYLLLAERSSSQRLNERWLSPEGLPNTRFSTLMSSSRSGQ